MRASSQRREAADLNDPLMALVNVVRELRGDDQRSRTVGAKSAARACSRVALKCNAACLSADTFKLTPHMNHCL